MTDVPLQIINGNGSLIIQTEEPFISQLTLVFTVILAVAAIAGVLVSLWQTRKSYRATKESNDLLRTEITARLRPLVSLGDIAGSVITKSDGEQYLQVSVKVSNTGTIEMRNLRIDVGAIEAAIFIEQIVKSKADLKTRHEILTTFLPNRATGEITFYFKLEELEKGNDTIVFWFHYKFLKFEEEAIQTLHYNMTTKAVELLAYYSQHDILDAREAIKNASTEKPREYDYSPK